MITEAAEHFAYLLNNGRWGCTRCLWIGKTIDDYWAAHETRCNDDNISF